MKRWISFGLSIFVALLASLPASAEQNPFPLGSTTAPYGYYEYLPDGYDGNGSDEWPVVIFLHGLGQTGNGTDQLPRVLELGVPQTISSTDYPFLVISPQSPGEWNVGNIDAMIEFVKSTYRIDPDRIYVTGISLGGGGTWNYAKAHPEKLAAILPICGSASVPNGAMLDDLPTWAFHSWGDPMPMASAPFSVDWVNAIAEALSGSPSDVMANYPGTFTGPPGPGNTSDDDRTASFDANTGSWIWRTGVPDVTDIADGHPNLTLYWDTSHDSWTRTYANQDAWDWLLAQERDSGPCDTRTQVIAPAGAGAAGGGYFPLEHAFDAEPRASTACEPLGGSGGSDAPALSDRVGYIDFGPDWQNVRITSTWTRYRSWSLGNQTPYAELWWDDDTDSTNDSGLDENDINFNTAPNLETGPAEPWLRDRDLRDSPVTPQARYLLLRTPANMDSRAKEYAILGHTDSDPQPTLQLIVPTGTGTASGSIYFPMQDAFDGDPTLNASAEPEGGTGGNQAPYLANRAGYIDFGPEWYKVRITSTWTQYRTWSLGNQTPYADIWWDDDTDSTNDSGLDETEVNFNTAQGLNTGLTEPWLQDRDLSAPVAPQARYLLLQSPSNMTDRAKEYAIVGFIDPDATP